MGWVFFEAKWGTREGTCGEIVKSLFLATFDSSGTDRAGTFSDSAYDCTARPS